MYVCIHVGVRLSVHVPHSLTCHPAPLRAGEVVLFSVSRDRMENPPLLFFLLIFFNLPLGRPLPSSRAILSPVLSTLYLSLPLTCLTDIDVHRIWQMWHFYQSPLNAFTSLTEALSEQTTLHASDSLAIHMSTLWNITYGQSGISFSIKPRSHWQQWSLLFSEIFADFWWYTYGGVMWMCPVNC